MTQEELRDALDYSPDTGVFIWKKRVAQRTRIGDIAGSRHHNGYITFFFKGKQRQAHRMAWLYVHGYLPDGPMDHINGVRDDNRIANLRPTTAFGNAQNRRKPQKGNLSGFMGVARNGKNWQAYIVVNKKHIYLGTYKTPEEANAKYVEAKRLYHSTCTI